MGTKNSTPVDEELLARVFSYGELVDYQEGSIVSRTIIDKPIGTVTVFAFGKGEKLSEHTAPYDALIQVVDGTATITIEGIDHTVTAQQEIIMPANKPHAVAAPVRFKMVLTMIRSN